MPGQTGPFGHRVFLLLRENLMFQKNSTGICGQDPQRKLITILLTIHSNGVAGGHLAPVLWEIWLVILWILSTASCLYFILNRRNAVSATSGRICGPKATIMRVVHLPSSFILFIP